MENINDNFNEEQVVQEPERHWAEGNHAPEGEVMVETGRGSAVAVRIGQPFASEVDRVAEEAHYGGYYRVFLNGLELLTEEEAPATVERGMRIAVTAYDKVG